MKYQTALIELINDINRSCTRCEQMMSISDENEKKNLHRARNALQEASKTLSDLDDSQNTERHNLEI